MITIWWTRLEINEKSKQSVEIEMTSNSAYFNCQVSLKCFHYVTDSLKNYRGVQKKRNIPLSELCIRPNVLRIPRNMQIEKIMMAFKAMLTDNR